MERFLDKLKLTQDIGFKVPERSNRIELEIERPGVAVVSSVTMGKQPHAGHLFLLSICDQMKSGLGSELPVTVVNNNTGPRPAGAVVAFSEKSGLPINVAAAVMSAGRLAPSETVQMYRGRSTDPEKLAVAMAELASSHLDVFASVVSETETVLAMAGFETRIVSESTLLAESLDRLTALSPAWAGSGFLPFVSEGRLSVLQKLGQLTATGALTGSLLGLGIESKTNLMVAVDSMPDTNDAAFVFSAATTGECVKVPGAGVGFGGKIASGTTGEAVTIKDLTEQFLAERPGRSLRQAAVFLTLTRPLSLPSSDNPNLADSFYDFKDNEALIDTLLACDEEVAKFDAQVANQLKGLEQKIGQASVTTLVPAKKMLEFLPQRAAGLINTDAKQVLGASKKFSVVPKLSESGLTAKMGYSPAESNPYTTSERKLVIRGNYFFGQLNNLLETCRYVESLTAPQFETIESMVKFCLTRLGL